MESAESRTNAVARLVLIGGVMASFAMLIAGLVMQSGEGSNAVEAGSALLHAGLLTLLGTPVVRVVVLVVGYVRERRATFALAAFCILLLLGASFVIGMR